MHITRPDLDPARERTNLGLCDERATTDVALQRASSEQEIIADANLEVARDHADENIRECRECADALQREGQNASPQSGEGRTERTRASHEQRRERALADSIVEGERERVDDAVRIEREERHSVDDELRGARAQTDDRLRHEREVTDEAVNETILRLLDEQSNHARAKGAVAHREEVLAHVSHELRSPLTAIALNTRILLDAAPTSLSASVTKRTLEDVEAACAQMAGLVSDLLDIASMETGKLIVTLARGDLMSVMREALTANAPMLRSRCLSLAVSETEDPLFACFDRGRLLQVFANLFANAIKFTRPGDTISVGVSRMDGAVRFCVGDTGCGIPHQAIPHLFERFWQLGRGDRGGLGLGLCICKAIVEAQGGRIWLTSEVGVGSNFYFTVPEVQGNPAS